MQWKYFEALKFERIPFSRPKRDLHLYPLSRFSASRLDENLKVKILPKHNVSNLVTLLVYILQYQNWLWMTLAKLKSDIKNHKCFLNWATGQSFRLISLWVTLNSYYIRLNFDVWYAKEISKYVFRICQLRMHGGLG